jgi:hypothetical protein
MVLILPLAVIITSEELGIAVVGYSPLGHGFLTGQIKSRDDLPKGDMRLNLDRFTKEVSIPHPDWYPSDQSPHRDLNTTLRSLRVSTRSLKARGSRLPNFASHGLQALEIMLFRYPVHRKLFIPKRPQIPSV